jgi:hypothetical protein
VGFSRRHAIRYRNQRGYIGFACPSKLGTPPGPVQYGNRWVELVYNYAPLPLCDRWARRIRFVFQPRGRCS